MSEKLVELFPELVLTRGHYICPHWGKREHWWAVTKCGQVIDPTVDQFPSRGNGRYEPWDESQPEPTGKCPNCGAFCYDFKETCTEQCYQEYANYLMTGG